MDHEAVYRLQNAVVTARHATEQARLDNCDVSDIDDALEALDAELAKSTPNKNTVTLYLNSVARSLIAAPSARDARDQIDRALRLAGLPATWEQ